MWSLLSFRCHTICIEGHSDGKSSRMRAVLLMVVPILLNDASGAKSSSMKLIGFIFGVA